MEEAVRTEGGVKRNLLAEYRGYLRSGLKRFFVNDWQIWVSFLAPCLIMIISYLVFGVNPISGKSVLCHPWCKLHAAETVGLSGVLMKIQGLPIMKTACNLAKDQHDTEFPNLPKIPRHPPLALSSRAEVKSRRPGARWSIF